MRTAKALLIVLGAVAVGLLLLVSAESPGGLAPINRREALRPSAASGSSNDSIRSLRDKLRGISTACTNAEKHLAALVARHRSAAIAEAVLPTKIAELRKQIPRLESQLAAARRTADEAEQELAERNDRFRAFLEKYELRTKQETDWASLARKVASQERLSHIEESHWAGTPGDIQDIFLHYWRRRDRLAAERRRVTKLVDSAVSTRDTVAKSLSAAHSNLNANERALADSRKDVDETPALIKLAQADAARLLESRKQLTTELVEAEEEKHRQDAWLAAEQQRAKAATDAENRRLAEAERLRKTGGGSVTYTFAPNPGGALGNLPPAVRTLILAEAAGVDTGVDLLPDDEMSPIGIVRDVLAPVGAPAVGVEIHADGMGVTTRQGNQTLVERANGPSSLYARQGPWESVQYSNGVVGQRYFDDYRGVTQFDFVNPNTGVRTLGEQPYEGNDYGQGWSQQMPLW